MGRTGQQKARRAGDTDDFEEPPGLQLPLQQPNLSSLAKEWFTFVMPTSSLIDFSNHCTKIVLEEITSNFILSFQLI